MLDLTKILKKDGGTNVLSQLESESFSLWSKFPPGYFGHNFFKIRSNSNFVPLPKNLFNLMQNSEKSALICCSNAEQ